MNIKNRLPIYLLVLAAVVTVIILTGCGERPAQESPEETPGTSQEPQSSPLNEARELLNTGIQHHLAGDNLAAITALREARDKRPNHPRTLSVLSQIEALAGEKKAALKTLSELEALGLTTPQPIETNENYASLYDTEDFGTLAKAFANNELPIGTAQIRMTLPEKVALIESVALDRATGDLFFSSIIERRILRYSSDHGLETFANADEHGLFSVSGLKVDDKNHLLWATAAATDLTEGLLDGELGASGLYGFDLGTGELRHYVIHKDEDKHWFGDLLVLDNGNILVSDSLSPTLYLYDVAADELLPFISDPNFVSLQGLDLLDDNTIVVADYATGLFMVDLSRSEVVPLKPQDNVVPYGIDGLYTFKGDVIAIQNGTNPQRVTRIRLDREAAALTEQRVLVQGHEHHFEPTLGVIVEDQLWYVANSGWPLYGPDRRPTVEEIPNTVILRASLAE